MTERHRLWAERLSSSNRSVSLIRTKHGLSGSSTNSEWTAWNELVQTIGDSPDYDPQTCSEAIKDGWDSLRKHKLLREKTLVFLRNHFTGAAFIFENWPTHPHEDVTSRLRRRVPNWIHRLQILEDSVAYARVSDGFWKEKGQGACRRDHTVARESGGGCRFPPEKPARRLVRRTGCGR